MDSANPLVSIVIPSYNYGRYLPCAIESVLGQTYQNLELIIVDNASTDDSLEIAKRYVADPRVTVLEIKDNCGPVPAWNLGFQHIHGEWFAMLPADDFYDSSKIECQIAYAQQHPNIGMIGTYVRQVDEHGQTPKETWIEAKVNRSFDFEALETWDWDHHFCIPTAIYRSDICRAAGPLSEGLHSVVDIEFHVRLLRQGAQLHVIPEQLTNYRWHTQNQSGKKDQKTAHQWVYYQISQFLPLAEEKGKLTPELMDKSLKKFFSQFYYRESSIREIAAFMHCFSHWRDFKSKFPDYTSFAKFVESYPAHFDDVGSTVFFALADESLRLRSASVDARIKKHYSKWLSIAEGDVLRRSTNGEDHEGKSVYDLKQRYKIRFAPFMRILGMEFDRPSINLRKVLEKARNFIGI